jgi:hypothetical protein
MFLCFSNADDCSADLNSLHLSGSTRVHGLCEMTEPCIETNIVMRRPSTDWLYVCAVQGRTAQCPYSVLPTVSNIGLELQGVSWNRDYWAVDFRACGNTREPCEANNARGYKRVFPNGSDLHFNTLPCSPVHLASFKDH